MSVTVRIHEFPRADRALLTRLEAARTPDVANVIGPSCVADPAMRPVWRGARALGSAYTVRLTPGGQHLMLIDLKGPMVPGTRVALSLRFAEAGTVEVDVPVVDARAAAAAH